MACNCSKKNNSSGRKTYTVKSPTGRTRTFSSEADAQKYARVSGGKIV